MSLCWGGLSGALPRWACSSLLVSCSLRARCFSFSRSRPLAPAQLGGSSRFGCRRRCCPHCSRQGAFQTKLVSAQPDLFNGGFGSFVLAALATRTKGLLLPPLAPPLPPPGRHVAMRRWSQLPWFQPQSCCQSGAIAPILALIVPLAPRHGNEPMAAKRKGAGKPLGLKGDLAAFLVLVYRPRCPFSSFTVLVPVLWASPSAGLPAALSAECLVSQILRSLVTCLLAPLKKVLPAGMPQRLLQNYGATHRAVCQKVDRISC